MQVQASNPKFNGKVPHLLLSKGEISEIVLPGNPARVDMVGELLENFSILAANREYRIGRGNYRGYPITVCSTGIGAASTEIAVIELIEIGAKALIRIGGTSALQAEMACGDLIISTACTRQGGSSEFYAPSAYPAVASYQVINSLIAAANRLGKKYYTGISASVGSFFAGQGRDVLGKSFYSEDLIEQYKRLNVVNMEMEAETIMTLASIFGVLSGSVCAIHANRATDEWMYDFAAAETEMCKVALEASVHLYEDYLSKS